MKSLKLKTAQARYNILFMIILSVVNIYFIFSSGVVYLPFSSSFATYAVALGVNSARATGNKSLQAVGVIIACVVLLILLICYICSKTKPFFLFFALTFVAVDTIFLLIMSVALKNINTLSIFDIIIHIMTLYYLYSAVKSYRKSLKKKDKKSIENESYEVYDNEEHESGQSTASLDTEPDLNQPLGKYIDDGTPSLLRGEFNELTVFAVIRNGIAELIINDYICDALDATYESEFELRAIVNNIDFSFQYRRAYDGETMYLYADDTLLDSLGRN